LLFIKLPKKAFTKLQHIVLVIKFRSDEQRNLIFLLILFTMKTKSNGGNQPKGGRRSRKNQRQKQKAKGLIDKLLNSSRKLRAEVNIKICDLRMSLKVYGKKEKEIIQSSILFSRLSIFKSEFCDGIVYFDLRFF
jgi:hypothetical protein